MEEAGYTRSYRRRWSHPAFRNLRDAAIWSWMTDAATWRDTAVRFSGQTVNLKRGQLVTSERFLAEGFVVDRQVIRRYLDNLVSEHMVSLQKTHGGTVITICNYDKYQASQDSEQPAKNPSQTHDEPTTNPNKKEGNKERTEEYKFEGKTIRLKADDYDRWRKSFFAIGDFDAELTRIDASIEGKGWFAAASAKLNAKHQALLTAKKTTQAGVRDSLSDARAAETIKRAVREDKRYLVSRVSMIDAKKLFEAELITENEAAYCGYRSVASPNERQTA